MRTRSVRVAVLRRNREEEPCWTFSPIYYILPENQSSTRAEMLSSRHRSRSSFWLGMVLLLLQLGLPTAVSAMEAIRDADSAGRVVHVESEGTDDCALHHDHHFCQVVRNLVEGQRRVASPPLAVLELEASSSPRPAPPLLEKRSPWLRDRYSSRAPPTA